ncbi:hypothetical protein ACFQZ4_50685 [Catellatospora coxensis]
MRSDPTTQFVTAVKLRELRAQHSQLSEAYDQLTRQAETATDPYQRLRQLYRGLADLTYAGGKVHPELADLGVLANDTLPGKAISADLVERWSSRLADELTAGHLRSEFVFRFGVLLEQWATSGGSPQRIPPTRQLHELREHVLASPRPNDHRGLIENLLAGVSRVGPAKDRVEATPAESLQKALSIIANDQYQSARLRAEARRLIQDPTLAGELADVLTLLGTGPDALQWPAGGVVARAVWTRNKWRLYTDQDLPTTCLLDVLARRWEKELSDVFGDWRQRQAEDHRLERLWALNAPKAVLDGEQQQSAGQQSDPPRSRISALCGTPSRAPASSSSTTIPGRVRS